MLLLTFTVPAASIKLRFNFSVEHHFYPINLIPAVRYDLEALLSNGMFSTDIDECLLYALKLI
jgi:hypothetical protein